MAEQNTTAAIAASKEDVDKLAAAVRGFRDETSNKIEQTRSEVTQIAEQKVREILGEGEFPAFKRLEQELKDELGKIDRSGKPFAVRALESVRDDVKRRVYSELGARAIAAWCAQEKTGAGSVVPEMVRAQLAFTENKGGAADVGSVAEEWSYVMLDHSVARQILPPSRQLPLPEDSNSVTWPTITVRPSASKGTENNNGGGTDATLASKAASTATAEILKGHISFSKAIPPRQLAIMMTIIGNMLAEDLGHQEDVWFFTGGTSSFTGVLDGATGINGNVTFDGATSIDALNDVNSHQFFSRMKGRIQPNHIGKGVFVFGPETWTVIEGLTDDKNRPLYGTGPMGSTPAQFPAPVSMPTELRFLNRPVYLTSALPGVDDAASGDRFGLYFDPSAAAIASRPREIEIDDHAEAKELNRVIIQWELFALHLLQPTCAVAAVLG